MNDKNQKKNNQHEPEQYKTTKPLSIKELAAFCRKKGFIIPNSDIYGGMSGFFDYGHIGVELKNNIKQHWWKYHVRRRNDIVGIDGCIITSPKVWKASGHVDSFTDILVECTNCQSRFRSDQLIEDQLSINVDGLGAEKLDALIADNNIKCTKCKSDLSEGRQFNLMFKTFIGPTQDEASKTYLRPETAQLIFANFKAINETARVKLPFGIAQIGKAFRNEISPRNFVFRCREFEQMEIEYFVHPEKPDECPFIKEINDYELIVYSADMQYASEEPKVMKINDALEKDIIKTKWHAYWLVTEHKWFTSLGVKSSNLRIRQHLSTEKSHYALDTWDLEYKFPFGWKELQGMANRTDFDLQQHMKESKKDLSIFDEQTKKKVVPHVIAEPSQGVERAFMVFMFDAYKNNHNRKNIVLSLHPEIAPIKTVVIPLVSNKPELMDIAISIHDTLKEDINSMLDKSGSVGRRYARADEIGVPFCITIDFDSLENHDVTIRDRDTTDQKRVPIESIAETINNLIAGKKDFDSL